MGVTRHGLPLTCILLLLLLSADSGSARVFWRWGAAARSDQAVEAAGGRLACAAEVTLNGGQGHMTVFAFDRTLDEVVTALCAAFHAPRRVLAPTGTLGAGVIRASGRVLRFVILDRGGATVVFKFDQSEAEAERSERPPPDPIANVPAYPGAVTQFFVRDDDTRTDFAVSRCTSQPGEAASFYLSRLTAEGWSMPLPLPSATGPRPAMLVFERKNALCCIYISPIDDSETQIAVMHKQMGNDN